ncbi:hypothetical protein HGA34_01425 [Candidatus Falkowbacteria bacterium]|nr:hypothetical protein [Candidatus Falkowbacteria bacterium]
MKLQFKKYIYLLNDITNQLLKKDREKLAEKVWRLQRWVIGLSFTLLVLSLALAFFLFPYIINILNK